MKQKMVKMRRNGTTQHRPLLGHASTRSHVQMIRGGTVYTTVCSACTNCVKPYSSMRSGRDRVRKRRENRFVEGSNDLLMLTSAWLRVSDENFRLQNLGPRSRRVQTSVNWCRYSVYTLFQVFITV